MSNEMITVQLYIIPLFVFFLVSDLIGQKEDYQWVMGEHEYGVLIDFNGDTRDTASREILEELSFTNASICDENGELLLYTNGCFVTNANNEKIEGSDSLNFSNFYDLVCPNGDGIVQGALILKKPISNTNYGIIHHTLEFIQFPEVEIFIDGLYYSEVDMTLNEGEGKVVVKRQKIIDERLIGEMVTSVKHANGEDWWIITPGSDTNLFYKVLLMETGLALVDSQAIGMIYKHSSAGAGQACFSPDGSKYVAYVPDDGVMIYDFDRQTGMLSNFRHVMVSDSAKYGGVAISPNSRFAYISAYKDLYQIDLDEEDPYDGLEHIAHRDSFADGPFLMKFYLAQLAPDCKIYINTTNGSTYLHVIENPDEKGKACNFEQHSFKLPNQYFGGLPNFPHFRIDEDQVCDPTITAIARPIVIKKNELKIFPNPYTGGLLNLEFDENLNPDMVQIIDFSGKVVFNKRIAFAKNMTIYPGLESGVYKCIISKEGKRVAIKRFVVI